MTKSQISWVKISDQSSPLAGKAPHEDWKHEAGVFMLDRVVQTTKGPVDCVWVSKTQYGHTEEIFIFPCDDGIHADFNRELYLSRNMNLHLGNALWGWLYYGDAEW